MSAYSKLIGTVIGAVVGIVATYLATKGLATCSVPGDASSCAIFGMSTAQITGLLTTAFGAIGTYFAPANA